MRERKVTSISHRVVAITMSALLLFAQAALPGFSAVALGAETGVEHYIKKLSDQNIMFGDQNGNMNADRSITRAEFVAMVNRAFGLREADAAKFSDVTGDEWYANDIIIAKTAGYFSGAENNKALPNNTLTREQATALVFRNLHYDKVAPENYTFTDSMEFSTWGRPAINTASQKGFVTGYNDGSFRPTQDITRGEVAKMLSLAVGDQIADGGEKSLGSTEGNVTVVNSGATLRDTIINGDLYITRGVGLGFTTFENVTVTGETIVTGAGASNAGDSSILFKDCNMGNVIVDGPEDKTVALRMDGNTNIQDVKVKSNTIIEEYSNHASGFHNVILAGPPDTSLHLLGDFDKVSVMMPKNMLYLDSGSVAELVVDEEAPDSKVNLYEDTYTDRLYLDIKTDVSGSGDVGYLKVNASDSKVAMLPDVIDITPGLTGKINGKEMTNKDGVQSSSQPKILSKYPVMDEIAPTSVKVIYKTNKAGTLYYAVTLKDEDKLSDDEILKPTTVKSILKSAQMTMKAETELTQTISGLKVNTDYRISAILKDGRGDVSAINSEDFTTVDNVKPAYASGYPKINSTTNTSAEMSAVATKDVNIHWAVLLRGHQAPTEIELKKDKAEGAITKGSTKMKKNEISTFTASGLTELKDYDLYMILTDGENDSAIKKLAFTTKDMTPPEIGAGYPRLDKVTEKSVIVKAKSNENGTIYYAVMKRGATFPPPIEGIATPSLDSEEAKRAVVTANNTLKNGRSAARADTEVNITVGGLSPETTYDLYMVAEDNSKNLSAIKTLVIKTSDTIVPKATQEFEDMVGEKPNDKPEALTDIRIVFSEEVWNSLTSSPITVETMQDCILLYDMTNNKKPLVPLDYYQAEIVIVDGKTVITFPAAARPENLRSGNKYQFELNNIVDTSGNKMQQKTKLPEFQIVAPLVELISTTPPERPIAMDMTFQIQPTSVDTADEMLFDSLIYSDMPVEFQLYIKNKNTQVFEPINEVGSTEPRNNIILNPKGNKSLYAMMDRTDYGPNDIKKIPYPQFNTLEAEEYGIFITKIGTSNRGEWSGIVKMKVKSLIGGRSILDYAPKNYDEATTTGGGIAVNTPINFEMNRTFQDNLSPEFVSPYPNLGDKLDSDGTETVDPGSEYQYYSNVGDVIVRPKVGANKTCMLYYLIAPRGTTGIGGRPIGVADIIDGVSSAPDQGAKGKFQINQAFSEKTFDIVGLTHKMDYDMYMVLVSGETSSLVETLHFRTKDVYAPKMTNVRPQTVGDGYVDIAFEIDRTALIDWIVYRSPNSGGPAIDAVTIDVIRAQKETATGEGFVPIAGARDLRVNVPLNVATATPIIKAGNLKRDLQYNFYAVARSPLGGQDSEILILKNFTPADRTPLSITVSKTVIQNPGTENAEKPYSGAFTLLFSEPAYYYTEPTGSEEGKVSKLDFTTFMKSLSITSGSASSGGETVVAGRVAVTSYSSEAGGSLYASGRDSSAIKNVTFQFNNVLHNTTISCPLVICDSSGNKTGTFVIEFQDKDKDTRDGSKRSDSMWSVFVSKVQ